MSWDMVSTISWNQTVPSSSGIVVPHGPLAQLVAHLHDAQGVRGSSPLRPTNLLFGFWRGAASLGVTQNWAKALQA